MADPIPIEAEAKSLGLCDHATALELQAQYDAEHGLPRKCYMHDGSEPPPGAPRMLLHCIDPEPVTFDAEQKPVLWTHPLPRAALKPATAARVQLKTPTEIADLKRAQPVLPDVEPIKKP